MYKLFTTNTRSPRSCILQSIYIYIYNSIRLTLKQFKTHVTEYYKQTKFMIHIIIIFFHYRLIIKQN